MPDMPAAVFQALIRYIGFTKTDADNVRSLASIVTQHTSDIADALHKRIARHLGTGRTMTGGARQAEHVREVMRSWLDQLFQGAYDDDYARQRLLIGEQHAENGLPQYYLVAAQELAWRFIESHVRAANLPKTDARLASLRKLLAIDLALILESYRQSYANRVRQTERAAVRQRLYEAEHLAHIGHLAASLAHEIKNPLAGISGAVQVLREPMPADHPHRPILTEVLRQIDRLDGTVKDLLVYARPRAPRFQRCSLNKLIERVLAFLRGEPDVQRVRIEYVDSQKLDLYADEGQLEQLLINLLLNAAQASDEGDVVGLYVTSTTEGLRLTITDEGQGMDEEVVRQAFEPFYTTKARGTGLGLPICRKIVEAHGGVISIQSVPGLRTTVAVRLPRFPPASTGGQSPDEYPRPDR